MVRGQRGFQGINYTSLVGVILGADPAPMAGVALLQMILRVAARGMPLNNRGEWKKWRSSGCDHSWTGRHPLRNG